MTPATPAAAASRIVELYDHAVEDLTAGLPDVECAVCLHAAPLLHFDAVSSTAEIAEARGRLLAWLAGVQQQLRLGQAVDMALARAHRSPGRAGST